MELIMETFFGISSALVLAVTFVVFAWTNCHCGADTDSGQEIVGSLYVS